MLFSFVVYHVLISMLPRYPILWWLAFFNSNYMAYSLVTEL